MTDPRIEILARAALNSAGFGFYTDPMEAGQDAYDLSLQALDEAAATLRALTELGWHLAPNIPTEEMMDAARGIVMMDRFNHPSPSYILGQCVKSGFGGEDWGFAVEPHELLIDFRLPKGHLCYLIYRAMSAKIGASNG